MNKNEEVLLKLLKSSLFGLPAEFPDDTDWEGVLKEAKAQMVVSLVSSAVPSSERYQWEIPSAMSKAHFMRSLYEQTKLIKLLDGEKIPFVIIKGFAVAVFYPEPSRRTMGDIDILVGKDYFDTAFELLKANGYQFKYDFEDGRDYIFIKDEVVFELHHRYSDKGYDIEELLDGGINRRITREIYGNSFPSLPDPVNGLLILDHIRHHLYGGLGIRQIIDFMLFVKSAYDNGILESECFPLFESAGLDTLATVIIKMCKMYFGLPCDIDRCNQADGKTSEEFFERLLSSGNFGLKDPYEYRPMKQLTIDIRQNGIFKTLQSAGIENCEIFKKYSVLRPFAWIYQTFRYIGRGITAVFNGEKFTGDINAGKKQSDLFSRLGLK